MEYDRQHVGPNSLHERLVADVNIEAGESLFDFKAGGGDLKDKATKRAALDEMTLKGFPAGSHTASRASSVLLLISRNDWSIISLSSPLSEKL